MAVHAEDMLVLDGVRYRPEDVARLYPGYVVGKAPDEPAPAPEEEKAAEEPENKAAEEPENKAPRARHRKTSD